MKKLKHFLKTHWILLILLIIHLFFRLYKMEVYNTYGWDQVDNAWASVNIIIHHQYPLVGMVAKGNSGIYIGPIYYYAIAFFYWLFHFDPIASGIFAACTSLLGFFVIYFSVKNIFSKNLAYFAVFINAVSYASIHFDRIQWPVDLIPGVSLLIFYLLYKVITGNPKYILYLAIATGFAFHVHFTAIFFPLFILFSLPFFPRQMKTLWYIAISIPIFVLFFIPNVISMLQTKNDSGSLLKYGNTYYHGFHLKRVMQLTGDAFIQFEPYLFFNTIKVLKFILLPVFSVFIFFSKFSNKGKLVYLFWLWFVIPWFVFATYSGEITDYYFSVTRYLVIIIIVYLLYKIYSIKTIIPKIVVIISVGFYMIVGLQTFFADIPQGSRGEENIAIFKEIVRQDIIKGTIVQYRMGDPESLLYYLSTRNSKK